MARTTGVQVAGCASSTAAVFLNTGHGGSGLFIPHVVDSAANQSSSALAGRQWFAAYTAPRHEKFVQAQLVAKQIHSFLPIYTAVRRWKNGVKREIQHPLLPGYVFVSLAAGERLPVLRTEGVLYLVGNGATPVPLDDYEVRALRVGAERASLLPHASPGTGDKVSIKSGPFQGVQGFVQQDKGDLTLVVTIELIQKSFAIRVQADELELAS